MDCCISELYRLKFLVLATCKSELGAMAAADAPVAAEVRAEPKFREHEVVVPEGVQALGITLTHILQGWGDVTIKKVLP